MITYVTHSQTETLKGTGSPCHYISIWLKMGLFADTGYVQSASFSIIYFTSILLKSGVIFFGITLISDGVLSCVSWLNLFMENIDVSVCASLP